MKIALVTLFAIVAYSQAQKLKFGGYNPFGFSAPFRPNPFTIQSVSDAGEPSEDQTLFCTSLASFKAKSFNAIRFTTIDSYRDGNGMRTLYEDDDGNMALYDFPAGKVSVFADGTCSYYENENLKISLAEAIAKLQLNFEVDQFAGTEGQGYTVTNGDVTFRGVINRKCADVYNFISINNIPETIIFTTGFDFTFDVSTKLAEADAVFATFGENCTELDLDFN